MPLDKRSKIVYVANCNRTALADVTIIMVMDSTGENQRPLIANETCSNNGNADPVWSPDGKRLAFVSNRTGDMDIFITNDDGTNLTDIYRFPGAQFEPSWSPDGNHIVFTADAVRSEFAICTLTIGDNTSQLWDICNFYVKGRSDRKGWSDTHPSWSPDGKQIAFASDRTGKWQIYVVNVDGTNLRKLTNDSANNNNAKWARDARYIAFDSDRGGNRDIYVMEADGKNQRQLTHNAADDDEPSWSPDGDSIIFVSDRTGNKNIYLMDADGRNQHALTNTRTANFDPDWQP
ncbi:MAG: PD40 domain-containing protein [Anaerolineae bacterium]|nr:PD40 domain-containing protein [Anaerolineae bacterium]